MWNVAFNYIMKIKQEYISQFHLLDTYSIKEMCLKLNKEEYNLFLSNVAITVFNEFNLFKYDITNEDIYKNPNSIYREMRSLVIDIKNDEIVLCPFRKFFNINEIPETDISIVKNKIKNANNIEITNKLDGSMQNVRYYHNQFIMSGSQALDATNSFRLEEGRQWFDNLPNYQNMVKSNPNYTFSFEYISQKDKHVVQYTQEQQGLYLIGIRDVTNGKQLPYHILQDMANQYNILMTTIENNSLDDILTQTKSFLGTDKEGWVLNIDGELFKIKCDDYVYIHKVVMGNNSSTVILDSVKNGTFDDMLSKIPTSLHSEILNVYNYIIKYRDTKSLNAINYYNQLNKECTDKEFALQAQEIVPKEYLSYMFMMRKNKHIDYLKNIKYYQILQFLGII